MGRSDQLAGDLALRFADARDADADAVVTDALRRLAETVGADRAYVTLYHDDGTFENSHEWTAEHVVPQLPAIQRLRSTDFAYSYATARRGEVLAVPDLSALPEAARAEHRSFSSFRVRAVLQVPITADGQGIGLIGINHFHVVDGWSDDFVDTVTRVGRVIAGVIHRRRSAQAARRAYEEAERANRIKEQLLTQLGHELRTPLHAILGYAELLELDDRPEEDRDALRQIQVQGRLLVTLVEDLVALARDEVMPTEDVDLGPLVDTVVDGVRHVAQRRGIELAVGDGISGTRVRAEAGRLRQVLYCLVSGAVQALDAGGRVLVDSAPAADLRVVAQPRVDAGDDDLVMPLARTLLDGHGTVQIVREWDDRVAVDLRLTDRTDQVARP